LKNKLRSLSIITLMFTIFLIVVPVVSAKSRRNYLADFLFQSNNNNEIFGDSYEETFYALEIIDYFNIYIVEGLFSSETKVDKATFIENLETKIEEMFDTKEINLYNLYYLLSSLNILNNLDTLDSKYIEEIHKYINQTSLITGGFAITNETKSANLVSTYIVYNIYKLIEEPIVNQTNHINWILSCNNTDGGYGGNQTLTSTILTTYCAIFLISDLSTIDDLINKTATLNYLMSFYSSDPSDSDNFGGYFPDYVANFALLSSTYFCVESIDIIDQSQLHRTAIINWVLDRQNFIDGGFIDNPYEEERSDSSIPTSYYAFKILRVLNALDYLNQEVFMVEFNFIILIVLLSVIGIVIVIVVFIWRKRRI